MYQLAIFTVYSVGTYQRSTRFSRYFDKYMQTTTMVFDQMKAKWKTLLRTFLSLLNIQLTVCIGFIKHDVDFFDRIILPFYFITQAASIRWNLQQDIECQIIYILCGKFRFHLDLCRMKFSINNIHCWQSENSTRHFRWFVFHNIGHDERWLFGIFSNERNETQKSWSQITKDQ